MSKKKKFIKNFGWYGVIGEFGWSGYASTYFMVDPVNRISAVLMMQIIDGERILKQDFYNNIFKKLKETWNSH